MFYFEKNFITEEERLAVKQKVLDLKDHWDNFENVTPNGANVYSALGNALYLMDAQGQHPPQINWAVQEILIENFNWLYQRICSQVADMTQCNTQLHPTLTAPGFHIGSVPGSYHVNRFHNDSSILNYDVEATQDTNYSVLIPIEVPATGACLAYMENNEEKELPYELGAFHQWKATLDHKIGDFQLAPGEYRITLQCHYYHNVAQDTNYIYF
jgi:hypothetical protein